MKVRCIDNKYFEESLTLNKEYEVIREIDNCYEILSDYNIMVSYFKTRFEIIEEPTEFTFQEAIARNIPGVYVNEKNNAHRIKSFEIKEDGRIIIIGSFENLKGVAISNNIKFKLQEPKKKVIIYMVEIVPNGMKHELIYKGKDNKLLQCYDFVICEIELGKFYGRIIDLQETEMTEEEYNKYNICWKA